MGESRDHRAGPRNSRPERLHRIEYQRVQEYIKRRMAALDLSQRTLSSRLGRGPNYINHILTSRRPIDLVDLYDLADSLGISPVELVQAGLDFQDDPSDQEHGKT